MNDLVILIMLFALGFLLYEIYQLKKEISLLKKLEPITDRETLVLLKFQVNNLKTLLLNEGIISKVGDNRLDRMEKELKELVAK